VAAFSARLKPCPYESEAFRGARGGTRLWGVARARQASAPTKATAGSSSDCEGQKPQIRRRRPDKGRRGQAILRYNGKDTQPCETPEGWEGRNKQLGEATLVIGRVRWQSGVEFRLRRSRRGGPPHSKNAQANACGRVTYKLQCRT